MVMQRKRLCYVGAGNMNLAVACAAIRAGHDVTIVDIIQSKVDMLNAGVSPVLDKDVVKVIAERKHRALSSTPYDCDVYFVGVETPISDDGEPTYGSLSRALETCPADKPTVIMSTLMPGSASQFARPGRYYHPVFLRAGSGVTDYANPGKLILGYVDRQDDERLSLVARVLCDITHDSFPAGLTLLSWEQAEWVKLAHNSFMTMKMSFANDFGRAMRRHGLTAEDAEAALDATFDECEHGRLLTPSHLRPFKPFDGPCMQKDARAAYNFVRSSLTQGCRESNDNYVSDVLRVLARAKRPVLAGPSFKTGFYELRDSLAMTIVQRDPRIRLWDVDKPDPARFKHLPDVMRMWGLTSLDLATLDEADVILELSAPVPETYRLKTIKLSDI